MLRKNACTIGDFIDGVSTRGNYRLPEIAFLFHNTLQLTIFVAVRQNGPAGIYVR